MPIGTPATLGAVATATNNQATYTLTTTATVPAGGRVIVGVGWAASGAAGTIASVTAGALSLVEDDSRVSGIYGVGLWSAAAPSGLASGSTITVDPSASTCFGFNINAAYVEGVATSSYEDASNGAVRVGSANTTAAWASGTLNSTGEAVGFAMAFADGSNSSGSSVDGNSTELSDVFNATDAWGSVLYYRKRADAGAVAVGGTWALDPGFADAVSAVAYKAAAGSINKDITFVVETDQGWWLNTKYLQPTIYPMGDPSGTPIGG